MVGASGRVLRRKHLWRSNVFERECLPFGSLHVRANNEEHVAGTIVGIVEIHEIVSNFFGCQQDARYIKHAIASGTCREGDIKSELRKCYRAPRQISRSAVWHHFGADVNCARSFFPAEPRREFWTSKGQH